MTLKQGRVFPIIITVILISIIIYLFATIKQPYVECSKTTTELGIRIVENLQVTLSSNNIEKMDLTKTIILPDNYTSEENNYLDSIKVAIKESYDYLPKKVVEVTQDSDRVIARVVVDDNETLILNNIKFTNVEDLQIKINANTKAKDVVTLKIKDSYTEGEFMTRMRNNGYSCK